MNPVVSASDQNLRSKNNHPIRFAASFNCGPNIDVVAWLTNMAYMAYMAEQLSSQFSSEQPGFDSPPHPNIIVIELNVFPLSHADHVAIGPGYL